MYSKYKLVNKPTKVERKWNKKSFYNLKVSNSNESGRSWKNANSKDIITIKIAYASSSPKG